MTCAPKSPCDGTPARPDPHPARPARHHDWRDLGAARQPLLDILATRCPDLNVAEDLTHEALLRASRFRSRQTEPNKLLGWLTRIASNVHRDHIRREARMWLRPHDDPIFVAQEAREPGPGSEPDALFQLADREHLESEVGAALERSWGELEERDRRVLRAFYGDGGSTAAAARACSVRRTNVKVRLHRARRRLEERIRVHLAAAALDRLTRSVVGAVREVAGAPGGAATGSSRLAGRPGGGPERRAAAAAVNQAARQTTRPSGGRC
ncbi:MAG: sigma-70 family RNA polymerase sigma factor [Planctomycetota bacterium]